MTTVCHPETEINSVTKRSGQEGTDPVVSSRSARRISPLPSIKDFPTYDIYLMRECDTRPNFDGLLQELPALADPAVTTRMMQRQPRSNCFLGLDLGRAMARIVSRRLNAAGAQVYPIPSAYRGEPKITAAEAAPIARRALTELQMTPRYRHLTFDPMHFVGQRPVCWDFGASCQEWLAEDRIPGVLHVSVDKLDGHVWQYEEFHILFDEPPYASPPPTHPRTQLVVWRPPYQL